MVDDLKRISESREIAQSSSLTHNTLDYDSKTGANGKVKSMSINRKIPKTAKSHKRKYYTSHGGLTSKGVPRTA